MHAYMNTHILACMCIAMCVSIPCAVRPVHLLRVVLSRVLESNVPGDSLSNSTDTRIPTP